VILRAEKEEEGMAACGGAAGPRANGRRRWFVATPAGSGEGKEEEEEEEGRNRGGGEGGGGGGGVLLAYESTVLDTLEVSLFVSKKADQATARALLGHIVGWWWPSPQQKQQQQQQQQQRPGGELRLAGVSCEWVHVVREVASAAGAREAWYNPCIAMHCPETGFKRPEGADPSDGRGVQLRWDTLVPGMTACPRRVGSCNE